MLLLTPGRCLLTFLFFTLTMIIWSRVPPKVPPAELLDQYTMNGQLPLEYFYVDDTMQGNDTHFIYSEKQILSYIESAHRMFEKFSQLRARFAGEVSLAGRDLIWKLPKKQWVYYSLFLHSDRIKDSVIGVFGSMDPWVETSLLALGAKQVVTIEYNRLTYSHDRLRTLSKTDFDLLYHNENSPYRQALDMAISISSFDHDGLGRYGDPLNPEGDFLAMQHVRFLLKPDGLLLLTVPVGPDVIVFNLHRRYGAVRLEALLRGYEIIERIGWDERMLIEPANYRQTYEPIFLLKPAVALPDHSGLLDNEPAPNNLQEL